MSDPDVTDSSAIAAYLHCARCTKELPAEQSMATWARLNVGWTPPGLQVWCVRHNLNVLHIDFEGQQHRPVSAERRFPRPASRPYHHPSGQVLSVDPALDPDALDALNGCSSIYVVSTCAGHPRGAHLSYVLPWRHLRRLAWPLLDHDTMVLVGPEEKPHVAFCRLAPAEHVADGTAWFHATARRVVALAAMNAPDTGGPHA